MNKIIAILVAGLFSAAAVAQTPAPAAAPKADTKAAAPAPKAEAKADAKAAAPAPKADAKK